MKRLIERLVLIAVWALMPPPASSSGSIVAGRRRAPAG